MKIRILFLCLSCMLVASCSTLFNRTTQKIYITTEGVDNARCILETEKMRYQVITPGVLHIERSANEIVVTCNKYGYKTGYTVVSSTAVAKRVWTGLNYYTPGIATDVATRLVYNYPDSINIVLTPKE